MTIEPMSSEMQERVKLALERASRAAAAGASPDDAIRKEAEAERFGPPVVQRMCEAFNVARTRAHMKSAEPSHRADSFPLADSAKITAAMYPDDAQRVAPTDKSADDLFAPPGRETVDFHQLLKPATVIPPLMHEPLEALPTDPDGSLAWQAALDRRSVAVKLAEEADGKAKLALWELHELVFDTAAHFTQIPHEPFATVEKRALARHGAQGKQIMDLLYAVSGASEVRHAGDALKSAPWPAAAPYAAVDKLASSLEGVLKLAAASAEADLVLDEAEAALRPPREKQALVSMSPVGIDLGAGAGHGMEALGLGEPSPAKGVLDPAHEAELDAVRTRAMLNQFVSSDPVLSARDPEEVTRAYREITSVAPTVAKKPAIVRDLLRKILQREGGMEQFEARDLSTLEQQMRNLGVEQEAA